ncbi:MAG TPA: TIGR02266 family protein [Kofleriaceae bacterium]|nr:TIGR02266 family protein [Kofleriaceae bacterium]
MGDERRRGTREQVVLVVDYDGADDLIGDYTENLSTGGTFIHTEREMEPGTEVQLVLSFPGLVRPIPIDGVVRWSRRAGPEGEPGVGIEFVRMDDESRRQLEAVIEAIARRDPSYVSRVVRVLVVEDNPHVAQLIREGLSKSASQFGDQVAFEFCESTNGREALEMCRQQRFDAAIIDVYLPILDGASVIQELRSDAELRAMPIIAVSAGGSVARQVALEAGADLFLDKPMRLRQVIESMQRLMHLAPRT